MFICIYNIHMTDMQSSKTWTCSTTCIPTTCCLKQDFLQLLSRLKEMALLQILQTRQHVGAGYPASVDLGNGEKDDSRGDHENHAIDNHFVLSCPFSLKRNATVGSMVVTVIVLLPYQPNEFCQHLHILCLQRTPKSSNFFWHLPCTEFGPRLPGCESCFSCSCSNSCCILGRISGIGRRPWNF